MKSDDAQVLHEVVTAFQQSPALGLSKLYIDVRSRVVTISGRVDSLSKRDDAERIARSIVGMRALVLELCTTGSPRVHVISP